MAHGCAEGALADFQEDIRMALQDGRGCYLLMSMLKIYSGLMFVCLLGFGDEEQIIDRSE